MEQKFYRCSVCGNIITFVKNSGVPVICCGKKMEEIIPGTVDASLEKHIPVIAVENNKVTVTVGAVEHPMIDAHYIEWIFLQTKEGNQRKQLKPNQAPKAVFYLSDTDEVVAAYEYCNLHGLWKKSL
ncbi:MAG TPA: desulfoferrodoxin family protein [Clostridia bacterium]|nr:desulfoferrodoxin family protein [Clostridia bacterium]